MSQSIEALLEASLASALEGAPPKLAAAMRHAVFSGGARIRPRLCLAVAEACGEHDRRLVEAAACALELLHAASLAHDDLPCFDDADERRGQPSVHRAFGEAIAVLTGDALIVRAFEVVALVPHRSTPAVLAVLARAAGAPHGLVAGQAWESEEKIDLAAYHRAKTASLFVAATTCGAIAAGSDPALWRTTGEKLGEAYQVADDLLDALATPSEAGKPTGRDEAHGRPSAVASLGVAGAVALLKTVVAAAADAIPECPGRDPLRQLTVAIASRLVPASLRQDLAAA